jgi:phenylpropionate dioxygenase-like ring-hydroxylating dioxygenase large terminal subunit
MMDSDREDFTQYWTNAAHLGLDEITAPNEYYTSPEFFALERERIFRKVWLLSGRVEEVPNPGDYVVRSIPALKASAIVIRGRDGVLRAFHNSCSHRGVKVAPAEQGCALTLRCPYHGWLYGADGTLRSIPAEEEFPALDKSMNGLAPIALDTWNGFYFLNFDKKPTAGLAAFLGGIGELFGELPFGHYPYQGRISAELKANWKNSVNGFNEGYHVAQTHTRTLHPQITTRENPHFHYYDIQLFGPHFTSTNERNFAWRPTAPTLQFVVRQMTPAAMPNHDKSLSETDFLSHTSINRICMPNFGTETITLFPNSVLQPLANGYLWLQFWPIEVSRTHVEIRLCLAQEPTTLRERFAADNTLAAVRDVMSEDFAMAQLQQEGLETGGKERQLYGQNEPLLRYFVQVIEHYVFGRGALKTLAPTARRLAAE